METLAYDLVETPLGTYFLAMTERGLCRCHRVARSSPAPSSRQLADWMGPSEAKTAPRLHPRAIRPFRRALEAYFGGTPIDDDLPMDMMGTLFQLRAWDVLRAIPYGETITYGEQAVRLGNPNAARAVGLANGANPIGIFVPCHRVIRQGGALGGYTGGLAIKRYLLRLEGVDRV